ncbi:hypothetical protein QOT17_000143 [Balamuthia mandrillaris]
MQLIVRECYPRLFELSQQLAIKTRGGSGGVVFRKSWFLNYTLWRLLQQKKTVLVESVARNKVWLFKESQVQEAFLEDKKQSIELFQIVENDVDAWYLFDSCGDIPKEPLEMRPFTVITASSNPQHNKQFYERTRNKYFIPCWSWKELKKYVHSAAQIVAPGLTTDQVHNHFKIFGGIPRYVYQTSDQANETKEELDDFIKQLNIQTISQVRSSIERFKYYQGQPLYQVLHNEVDPNTFKSQYVCYASDYISNAVEQRKLKHDQDELGQAVHELQERGLGGLLAKRYF